MTEDEPHSRDLPNEGGRGWPLLARLVASAAAVALLLAGGYWWGKRSPTAASAPAAEATAPVTLPPAVVVSDEAAEAIGLRTVTVEIRAVDRTLRLTGSVAVPPDAKGFVGSRVEGKVAGVFVNVGDRVVKGQLLATVQSSDFESLQVELLRVAAELPVAQAAAERLSKLLEIQAVAAKEVQAAQAQFEAKRSELAGVRERLEILGLSGAQIAAIQRTQELVRGLPILAPLGGVVVSRNAVLGSPVNTSDPILEIDNLRTVWIEGDVFESQAGEIRPGQPAHVTVAGLPGTAATGVVQGVVPSFDPEKRTARLRVVLDNPAAALKPGMFATLLLTVGKEPPGVAVPVDALIEQGGVVLVFVKNGADQYVKQEIVVVARDDQWAQVSRGLFPNDLVVTAGKMQIYTQSLYQ